MTPLPDSEVIAKTARWLERVVIGLNLCPFAKGVQAKQQIRYVVSRASTPEALLDALRHELTHLTTAAPEELDTTLLIHPEVLEDFADYNDFLGDADALLEDMALDGVLQIASFHPQYLFADSLGSDAANYTNRSPFPVLHLLREASVTRAVESFPDAATIYERNIETLRALPREELMRLVSDED